MNYELLQIKLNHHVCSVRLLLVTALLLCWNTDTEKCGEMLDRQLLYGHSYNTLVHAPAAVVPPGE